VCDRTKVRSRRQAAVEAIMEPVLAIVVSLPMARAEQATDSKWKATGGGGLEESRE
jgi:hypothetical protein